MSKKRSMSAAGQQRINWMKQWEVGFTVYDEFGRRYNLESIDLSPVYKCGYAEQFIGRGWWPQVTLPAESEGPYVEAILKELDRPNAKMFRLLVSPYDDTPATLTIQIRDECLPHGSSYGYEYTDPDCTSMTNVPLPFWQGATQQVIVDEALERAVRITAIAKDKERQQLFWIQDLKQDICRALGKTYNEIKDLDRREMNARLAIWIKKPSKAEVLIVTFATSGKIMLATIKATLPNGDEAVFEQWLSTDTIEEWNRDEMLSA